MILLATGDATFAHARKGAEGRGGGVHVQPVNHGRYTRARVLCIIE